MGRFRINIFDFYFFFGGYMKAFLLLKIIIEIDV